MVTTEAIEYVPHPLLAYLPRMSPEALQLLAADVKDNGLLDPCTTWGGKWLLDGRNREAACKIAGVPCRYVDMACPETDIPLVILSRINRNDITPSMRAAIGLQMFPHVQAALAARKSHMAAGIANVDASGAPATASKPLPSTPSEKHRTRDVVAQAMHVSPRLVQSAKSLQEKSPELFARVAAGETTITRAEGELKRQALKARTEANRPEIDARKWQTSDAYTATEKEAIAEHYPTLCEYNDELLDHAAATSSDTSSYFDEVGATDEEREQEMTPAMMRAVMRIVAAYMRLDDYGQRIISCLILHPAITVSELSTKTGIRRDYQYRCFERIKKMEPTLAPIVMMLKK